MKAMTEHRTVFYPGKDIAVGMVGKVPKDDPCPFRGLEFTVDERDKTSDLGNRWFVSFKGGRRELIAFPLAMDGEWFKAVFYESD